VTGDQTFRPSEEFRMHAASSSADAPTRAPDPVELTGALADATRLRVFAGMVLAGAAGLDVAELDALAGKKGAKKCLPQLLRCGAVRTLPGGRYAAGPDAFRRAAIAAREAAEAATAVEGTDVAVARLFSRGQLVTIPVDHQLHRRLIAHLAERLFEPDRTYTEREVNEAIQQVHQDFTTLRRALVDYKFLGRTTDGREYRMR
jgi:hypothetical protein